EHWVDPTEQGDYFEHVQPTAVGYLVWSHFPVTVSLSPHCSTRWVTAVHQALQEWTTYLPLVRSNASEVADVTIECRTPPLQVNGEILRARSAETRYQIFPQSIEGKSILGHRFTILLRPDQTDDYIQAAARHELGHALGIWGHSPLETDALYFSQVRRSPPISVRDINTLKRVYEQPTQLGWAIGDPLLHPSIGRSDKSTG
ncbi:MAG: hypothetical protein HC881_21305, partial [Leptolyngbyaceae cyanobacterium SL_7_1]|nr:hypothetical protein [Leptolyngbyaceae cyanobacterium SL_7_1]